jgi:hypothetical protein
MIKLALLLENENNSRPVQRGMDKLFTTEDGFSLEWNTTTKTYNINLDIVIVINRGLDYDAILHMRDDGTIQIDQNDLTGSDVMLRGYNSGWTNQGKTLTAKLWPDSSALYRTDIITVNGTSLTNCIIDIFQSGVISSISKLDIASIKYKVPNSNVYIQNL